MEGGDEFRAAIGVAAVIDGVDADEDVARFEDLGPGEGVGEEDRVAGGDVGDRDIGGHLFFVAVFGDVDGIGEGAAAELAEIDAEYAMLGGAELSGDGDGGLQFAAVTLAVVESEGVEGGEGLGTGDGEAGGAVEAAAG